MESENTVNEKTVSEPAEKTLILLEYLSGRSEALTLNQIVSECRIPSSTTLRILSTFVRDGYVKKLSNKRYVSNFMINKGSPFALVDFNALEEAKIRILEKTKKSVEVITVRGQDLYWDDKIEYNNLPIRIAATKGFRRSLYEMDAPSRLYLAYLGIKEVERRFNTDFFFTTGEEYRSLSWEEVKEVVENTNLNSVIYDFEGNSRGIRRFAVILRDEEGRFLFILSIAEPALCKRNEKEYIATISDMLIEERDFLLSSINKSA